MSVPSFNVGFRANAFTADEVGTIAKALEKGNVLDVDTKGQLVARVRNASEKASFWRTPTSITKAAKEVMATRAKAGTIFNASTTGARLELTGARYRKFQAIFENVHPKSKTDLEKSRSTKGDGTVVLVHDLQAQTRQNALQNAVPRKEVVNTANQPSSAATSSSRGTIAPKRQQTTGAPSGTAVAPGRAQTPTSANVSQHSSEGAVKSFEDLTVDHFFNLIATRYQAEGRDTQDKGWQANTKAYIQQLFREQGGSRFQGTPVEQLADEDIRLIGNQMAAELVSQGLLAPQNAAPAGGSGAISGASTASPSSVARGTERTVDSAASRGAATVQQTKPLSQVKEELVAQFKQEFAQDFSERGVTGQQLENYIKELFDHSINANPNMWQEGTKAAKEKHTGSIEEGTAKISRGRQMFLTFEMRRNLRDGLKQIDRANASNAGLQAPEVAATEKKAPAKPKIPVTPYKLSDNQRSLKYDAGKMINGEWIPPKLNREGASKPAEESVVLDLMIVTLHHDLVTQGPRYYEDNASGVIAPTLQGWIKEFNELQKIQPGAGFTWLKEECRTLGLDYDAVVRGLEAGAQEGAKAELIRVKARPSLTTLPPLSEQVKSL